MSRDLDMVERSIASHVTVNIYDLYTSALSATADLLAIQSNQ